MDPEVRVRRGGSSWCCQIPGWQGLWGGGRESLLIGRVPGASSRLRPRVGCPWAAVGFDVVVTVHPAGGRDPPRVCLWARAGPYPQLQEQSSSFGEITFCPPRTPGGFWGAGGLLSKRGEVTPSSGSGQSAKIGKTRVGMCQAKWHVQASLRVFCNHWQQGMGFLGLLGGPPCNLALHSGPRSTSVGLTSMPGLLRAHVDPSLAHSYASFKALAEPPPPGSHPDCPGQMTPWQPGCILCLPTASGYLQKGP